MIPTIRYFLQRDIIEDIYIYIFDSLFNAFQRKYVFILTQTLINSILSIRYHITILIIANLFVL